MVVLIGILCIACLYDYKEKRIPNGLTAILVGTGAARGFLIGEINGAGSYLVISAVVVFLLYPLFRIGGLGAGDVKLIGGCAGFFPVDKVSCFLFVSLLFSAVFSIIKLFQEKSVRDRVSYLGRYCREIAGHGRINRYLPQKNGRKLEGICMAGPVLCSVILRLGGIY